MKHFTKVMSVFVVISMLLACISGCKDDSSTPKSVALEAYNALESDLDKLLHVVPTSHPSAEVVAGLEGNGFDALSEISKALNSGNTVESGLSLTLDKLEVNDRDYLALFNGTTLALNGNLVGNKDAANLSLTASFSGVSIDADIYADKNALMIECPVAFQKPFYIPQSATVEVLSEAFKMAMGSKIDGSVIGYVADVFTWANESLDKDEINYIAGLLKDSLPVNCISSENVTVSTHKGNYINTDINAECVTLCLDAKGIDRFLTNVGNNVLADEVFKSVVVSFIDALIESGSISDSESDAEGYYLKFYKEFKNSIKNFDAENKDYFVTIKRYFSEGYDVMLDIELSFGDNFSASAVLWNVYNADARECGVKISLDGNVIVDAVGGSDKNNADLSIKSNIYKNGISLYGDGDSGVKDSLVGNLTLAASRKGETLDLNGCFEDFLSKTKMNFVCKDNGTECSATATATDDKGNKMGELKITAKTENGVKKLSADVSADIYGKKLNLKASADISKIEADKKNTVDSSFSVSYDGFLDLSAKLSFDFTTQSDAVPKSTKEEGCFTVNGKHDMVFVNKNLKPQFLLLMQGFGNTYPDFKPENGGESIEQSDDSFAGSTESLE